MRYCLGAQAVSAAMWAITVSRAALERSDVTLGFGQQQPALHGGHEREGELGNVGIAAKLSAVLHGLQSVADCHDPTLESGGKRRPGYRVQIRQLAGERPDMAAALALATAHRAHHVIPPCLKAVQAVEPGQPRPLMAEHRLTLPGDDRVHQGSLIAE